MINEVNSINLSLKPVHRRKKRSFAAVWASVGLGLLGWMVYRAIGL